MTPLEFERLLDIVVEHLAESLRASATYRNPHAFEEHVRDTLKLVSRESEAEVDPRIHPHAFPDIKFNGFGIEVKFTTKDTWLAVGNSVFEGMRAPDVQSIYVIFGKLGGTPAVRWARYEECVTHVRISHAPRFVIEMDAAISLFEVMDIRYDSFHRLDPDEKMAYIRAYTRDRLNPGERVWWLEDLEEFQQGLPAQITPYIHLDDPRKRLLRAEASFLCPVVVSRKKNKYLDPIMYILRRHGVLCHQGRDLFTAGSVALRRDARRGGNYIERSLIDLQDEMRTVAAYLESDLIMEYWDTDFIPEDRIAEWLRRADKFASDWIPSETLFVDDQE